MKKSLSNAVENQLNFLQHMIDTSPNLLFYIDTRVHYLGCNSAFTTLTGKNLKDLAGKTNAEIGSPWDVDLFERYNAELLDQSGIKTYTGLFHHMDETISKITIQKSTMTTIEGSVAGIVGIIISSEHTNV